MSGPLPSGFSSVDLDRWRSQSADRARLSDTERLAIVRDPGSAVGSGDARSGAVDTDSSGGPPEHEVLGVYAGLVELIAAHAEARHELRRTTDRLVGRPHEPVPDAPVPFVLGVAGSVAVGKSTVARVLQTLMARWPTEPKVQIVSTDSFLHPNAVLDAAGLTMQKGFPVSYDTRALIEFLIAVRSGAAEVSVPVYSHVTYDVIPGAEQIVQRPDVIILEGVNVLQSSAAATLPDPTDLTYPPATSGAELVSDHVDLSIYVDANETDIERWFVDRFAALRVQNHPDERAFYRQFAALSDEESDLVARWTWSGINRVNLREHIAPTRSRAQIVIDKAPDHHVRRVFVRDT